MKSQVIKYPIGPYSFQIHEEADDAEYDGLLFNSAKFLKSRKLNGKLLYFELRNADGDISARMNVTISESYGFSSWKAPFGSMECFEVVDLPVLKEFLSGILEYIHTRGVSELRVNHYPDFYAKGISSIVHEVYLQTGFKKVVSELNQHIAVREADFSEVISYAQRKRLNKCRRSGFITKMESFRSLQEAYDLVVGSRGRKDYPVTMSFTELSEMFEKHPSRYLIFSVRDDRRMVAAAISILISDSIIYNFYHADHENYLSFSPTVMAVDAVYRYCQDQDLKYIDLGISSLDGITNSGIHTFKKGLGAIDGNKNIYIWKNLQT